MEKISKAKSDKKVSAKTPFVEALFELILQLPQRSQDIIKGRYGIANGKAKTLEEIGSAYGITRERVRQVTREVFRKAKERENDQIMQDVKKNIRFAVTGRSGIMGTKELIANLGKSDYSEEGAIRFFLDCAQYVSFVEIKGEMIKSCSLEDFDLARWRKIKEAAKTALLKNKQPMEENSLFSAVIESDGMEGISKKLLFDSLAVSEELRKNNFGKWGLAKWKEITPKGTREKAYLILKEAGKPMHFRDIAKGIDKFKLTKKKAHPQTVHNELIKDKKFILVGRGIYALAEWGYERGTVKDVIEKIIKQSPKGLTKEEISKEVLKVRQVKKTTITINLNNFFVKNADGEYALKTRRR